jgi:hypothetical protein
VRKKLALVILLVLFSSLAMQQAELGLWVDVVDLTGFPEVMLTFNAWRETGVPLRGLTTIEVLLQEEGGPGFHPDRVVLNEDAPLAVALVLDVSGSMQGQPLEDAKIAAARFLDRLSGGDQAALVAFSNGVDPDPEILDPVKEMGFTNNLTTLYDLIEGLEAEGGTELYHAVGKAVSMTAALPVGHRAVLVLSDGVNEPADVGDPDMPIVQAQENGIPVYVIGLGNLIDEPYLRRLAAETGGYFRLTPKSSELAETFRDMAALLKTQYEASYTSSLVGGVDAAELTISIAVDGASVSEEFEIGPIPEIINIESTETPTPSATQAEESVLEIPTTEEAEIIDEVNIDLEENRDEENAVSEDEQEFPVWGWLLAAGFSLGLVLLMVVFRKTKPKPEKCANCGFDMTGKTGSCPQCGSERRLPKV